MRLGIRLLFAFFLINGIAAFFVLRVFVAEIKPSVREVMEDMMVDTAHILAELASDDLASGSLQAGGSAFARHVQPPGAWSLTRNRRPSARTSRSGATSCSPCAASTAHA